MNQDDVARLRPDTPAHISWLLLDGLYLAGYPLLAVTDLASYLVLAGLISAAMTLPGLYSQASSAGRGGERLLLLGLLLPFTVQGRYGPLADGGSARRSDERGVAERPALRRRLFSAVLLLLLFAACASGQFGSRVVDPALAPLEQRAKATLQRSLAMAAASYASARLIDRGIAFISETEVGIGVLYLKPGQIFKPLQDMAVRYSDIMVLAMVSVGTQLLLLELGQLLGISVFASAIFVTLLAWQFAPRAWLPLLSLLARALVVTVLLMKLAIPLTAVAIGSLAEQVLDARRLPAQAQIDLTTEQLDKVQAVQGDSGLLDWLKRVSGQASDLWEGVRNLSDNLIERLVTLLVIYVLETLLLPLLMLFLIWRLAGRYIH